ncbi:MAG: LL-diaminopimelate aminotransferase [Spirochaetales bacterium]|nr:LL-diaminopimelate aminotransferase [Spirochaetales bacterium]
MATINKNYRKLAAGYLFPEIGRRTRNFQAENPKAKLLRLGIGNTTEALTPEIVAGLQRGVQKLSKISTYTGYGDEQGNTALREGLAKFYGERGVSLSPDDIFVSDGAKPDSSNIQSIFGDDNIVAIQDPAYPVYVDTNVIFGRSGDFDSGTGKYSNFVYMKCDEENGFFPSLPDKKVDLIYLCSPNNPTGAVATKDQLKMFVDYAIKHQAVIIFDAAYSEYISNHDLPGSIYEVDGAEKCAIEINSFSKFAGFTGVRLGWTIVPEQLTVENSNPGEVRTMWLRRQTTFFNGASNIVQEGGLAVLSETGLQESRGLIDYYMQNASIIRSGLQPIGLTVYGGDNAPYLWLRTPGGLSSWDFFDKLLRETWVIGTPGSGFGPAGEGFFRLSAFGHRDDIKAAVDNIVNKLKL